jgi:hypothetical protein
MREALFNAMTIIVAAPMNESCQIRILVHTEPKMSGSCRRFSRDFKTVK